MKYIVVEIDVNDPEGPITFIGSHSNRTDARAQASDYVAKFPGSQTGVYEYAHGYSSSTRVEVSDEYYPPELPVQELPPGVESGPAQNWTEDVENAALAKAERAGLTDCPKL
jgi:hypothetical protein